MTDNSNMEASRKSHADSGSTSKEERRRRREEKLANAFLRPIEPVKLSALYRLGLLLVAVFMLLLPLLYVALTAAVALLTVSHAVQNVEMMEGTGSIRGKAVAYFGPIVAGATMVFFMVKPLLARRPKYGLGHVLSASRHRFFFEFLEGICGVLKAPMPRAVVIDLDVNASASFRRGFWSFLGDDLVLTIGLPVVQGLTIQNFAGLLAHELGHFSQRGGLRLTYIIRGINGWFARVVYERDSWDAALAHATENSRSVIQMCLLMANIAVWLSRRILWCFMMVGHIVSCFMLRQMEFNADQYQFRLAGSDNFPETFRRMYLLSAAADLAGETVMKKWEEGHERVESFPALVAQQAHQLPPQLSAQILQAIQNEKTHFLDTHPSPRDRIAAARSANIEPAFVLKGPATALFYNFDALARQLTEDRYDIRAPHM